MEKTENIFIRQIAELKQAQNECERFIIKAQLAIDRFEKNDNCYATKEMGAARRSALDVKREMTNINQLTMWTMKQLYTHYRGWLSAGLFVVLIGILVYGKQRGLNKPKDTYPYMRSDTLHSELRKEYLK